MSRYVVPLFAWRLAIAALGSVLTMISLLAFIVARSAPAAPPQDLLHDQAEWSIEHGVLENDAIELRPDANSIGLALHPIGTLTYTLQTRVQIDEANVAAGLIFAAPGAGRFSAFLISPDGYFTLGDYVAGQWQERIAWRTWPHIRRAAEPNRLRVDCTAEGCTFWVNDEWTWHEADRAAASTFGLAASVLSDRFTGTARFDQIELWH